MCSNSISSYSCTCNSTTSAGDGKSCKCNEGYSKNSEGLCVDINECDGVNACDINAECENSVSSFSCTCEPKTSIGDGKTCKCKEGYFPNVKGICVDIDECAPKSGVEILALNA